MAKFDAVHPWEVPSIGKPEWAAPEKFEGTNSSADRAAPAVLCSKLKQVLKISVHR
jgi:hypothetical protein